MRDSEKAEFKRFIIERKNEEALIRMFRAFEKCQLNREAQGVIKRIIVLPDGTDYRLFLQLKNLLFEYEISSRRIKYFKKEDIHMFLEIELKKEFIVAQMLTERDAYASSINHMILAFKKAKKFDFLQIQKDCSDNLSQYYRLTGDLKQSEYWYEISGQLNHELSEYNRLRNIFENSLNKVNCCIEHAKLSNPYTNISFNGATMKTKWMSEVLMLNANRNETSSHESLVEFNRLYRIIKRHPGVFPKEFRVVVLKFAFEDLYRLKKYVILTRQAHKVFTLNRLPLYNRIPLMNFFLHFLFKRRMSGLLNSLIDIIDSEDSYRQFIPFIHSLNRIRIMHLYAMKSYKSVLKILNQQEMVKSDCSFTDFQNRILEILCLLHIDEEDLAHDRLENLRRFVFRNDELRDSIIHRSLYESIRKSTKGVLINGSQDDFANNNVYNLLPDLHQFIKEYSIMNNPYSYKSFEDMAAEGKADNEYIRDRNLS